MSVTRYDWQLKPMPADQGERVLVIQPMLVEDGPNSVTRLKDLQDQVIEYFRWKPCVNRGVNNDPRV